LAKYRRRFDILADVVRVAGPGLRKTRIMYFANLSYALLKRYLGEAVGLGFLRLEGDEYRVTSKGEAFLEQYSVFSSRSSRVEADLESLRCEAERLERMCKHGNHRDGRRSKVAVLG